jgi:hypothetical protein
MREVALQEFEQRSRDTCVGDIAREHNILACRKSRFELMMVEALRPIV